jgi:adenosine deaminase
MFQKLDTHPIPVECCPTSNVMTLELAKYFHGDLVHGLKCHPRLKSWIDNGYPISINTDDPGIFNTDSTNELVLLADAFEWKDDINVILKIVEQSIEHIFESEDIKKGLRMLMEEYRTLIMRQRQLHGKEIN